MNIIWIVTTQWRAQACGYAGDPNVRTPVLDRLAEQSINYSQAITPHPFGPFARAALLTGKHSPENGLRDYFDPLPENAVTIAHRIKAFGYHTAFFGKWHLGQRDPAAPLVGTDHAQAVVPKSARGGFDFWEGFESGFQLNHPWLHGDRLSKSTQFFGYQSDVLFERSADWMSQMRNSSPWFCCVSIEPPHPPYEDAPRSGDQVGRAESMLLPRNVPSVGDAAEKARRELAGYYAHIEATDAALGRLLARIDGSTTAVIFTSVHGDMHGAHALFRKGWPYDESVRVPLLVRVPGASPLQSTESISLADLPNLTLQLAQTGVWPAFHQFEARISMPSVVRLPWQCDRIWQGIRNSERKLVLNDDGSPWLFFDLEKDPDEMENLVNEPSRQGELAFWTAKVNVAHSTASQC